MKMRASFGFVVVFILSIAAFSVGGYVNQISDRYFALKRNEMELRVLEMQFEYTMKQLETMSGVYRTKEENAYQNPTAPELEVVIVIEESNEPPPQGAPVPVPMQDPECGPQG